MNLDRTGVGHHKKEKKRKKQKIAYSASSAGANEYSEKIRHFLINVTNGGRLHGDAKIAVLHHRQAGGWNHGRIAGRRQCGGFGGEGGVRWKRRRYFGAPNRQSLYTGKKETSGASEGKNLPLLSPNGRPPQGDVGKRDVGEDASQDRSQDGSQDVTLWM